jgi:hypothetical protein
VLRESMGLDTLHTALPIFRAGILLEVNYPVQTSSR